MATAPVLNTVPAITSVQDMIFRSARVYGEKIALQDLKDTPLPLLTYASLQRHILLFGSALRALGLKERSHIAVIGENRVQWSLAYLTCMSFNYVVVPVDRNLPVNEVLNILHESDAVAVIYSDTFEPVFRESRSSMKRIRHYISMDLPKPRDGSHAMIEMIDRAIPHPADRLPAVNPDELAEIIFTSGSLGRAKGVMLTQTNLAANLMAMVSMMAIYPEDRFLCVLPIHHTYACTCGFLCPMYTGASVHFAQSLKTIVDDLQTVHATMLLAVPLLYDKMFKRIYKGIEEKKLTALLIPPLIKAGEVVERLGWRGFRRQVFGEIHEKFGGSIRCFIAGGAAQDPSVAKGLRDFGFKFVQGYGLTETGPILTLNQIDNCKDDSAGQALPGVTLKIDSPDHFGVGEICAKGANVMPGYYKNEAATADVFKDGWFMTGDLGKFDDDGFLHISGRKKNVIISKSGENVYPEEIEDLINRSPYILESLVYGEDDAKHDEIIAVQVVVDAEAFIERSETHGTQITDALMKSVVAEEIALVNKELPNFKQIRKFYIRDREFEKTTTQKVKRFLVQRKS
jgi:long-chain acyl-CoA synthetase